MRQHIYRAWIKPLKRYASDISMEFTSYGIPPMISACMQGEKEYSGEDVILEQYTGLTDKNGVKIFEGDIVENRGMDCDSKEYNKWVDNDGLIDDDILEKLVPIVTVNRDVVTMGRFPTYWLKKEEFGYEGELLASVAEYIVIGNIHQNPNLLTGHK